MGGLQPWHWLIVIAAFILLFGAKKLPDAARSLGKSMRIFKSEIKEMQADGNDKPSTPLTEGTAPATPVSSERVDTPEQSDKRTA
ncbi:Sec-independent protein translocase subunit TatA [Mycolicibacterium bacteremicum]|uniref:Sec-independent protein translocase protein TatA n=1 Tax=Mycolicibacterium bacteremicum TaxID=564198 RepID=A0A1W9Z478_MYCBA|nr:Sec-independent protein translocase subunit TatA [Mycolicibacterium bacteremicum]MCV7433831.1 Sec-independent protein translocase subunit TatA [Mycolicibacterium bacteremicum]ORA07146.1 Sec-independent protein translocase TatA [Mycolicibacterium bacteremicum]